MPMPVSSYNIATAWRGCKGFIGGRGCAPIISERVWRGIRVAVWTKAGCRAERHTVERQSKAKIEHAVLGIG